MTSFGLSETNTNLEWGRALDFFSFRADTEAMDLSLSTQMAQASLFDQVGASVARKGLDQQKIEGQNVLQLIESAAPAFSDPALGKNVDLKA
jgi:hypothetical protein